MSASGLLEVIIQDSKVVMDAQAKRINLLENQLLRFCSCGHDRFRTVELHHRRCVYRVALEIIEREMSRGG